MRLQSQLTNASDSQSVACVTSFSDVFPEELNSFEKLLEIDDEATFNVGLYFPSACLYVFGVSR